MNSTPTKKSKRNHVSNPGHLEQQIDLNTVPFKLKAPKQLVSESLSPKSLKQTESYCHCHICFQSHLYHSVHSEEGVRKRPFEDKGFDMLTCYGCELTVHRYCYGLKTPINQVKESSGQIVNMFICDRCSSVGPNELKECSVCQQKNGALKKIAKRDAYVHVTCALFSELYYIDDFEKMTVRGCNNTDKRSKSQHVCDYCKKQGNLFTCHASGCQTVSHIYCALKASVETKSQKPVWSLRLGNAENPVKTFLDYEDLQIKEIMKEIYVRLRRKDNMPAVTMAKETENENKNSSAKKKKKGKVAEEEVAPEHMLSEEEEATLIGISEEVKEKLKSIASGYGQGKNARGGSVEMQCRQHKMEDLYCICNKPNSSDLSMFACDSCDNWFHYQCFGFSKDQQEKINEQSYICKKCRLWKLFVNDFFAFENFKKTNPEESEQYEPASPQYETVGNLEIVPKDVSKFSISDFIVVCIIIQIQLNKRFYNVPEYDIQDDTLPKILLDNAKYIPFNLNGIMSQLLKRPLLAKGADEIISHTVPLDDYGVIESVYNPETGSFKADKLEKLEESLQVLSSIKTIYEEQGFPQTATLKDIEYRLGKGQWILEVYKALEGHIRELDKVPQETIQILIKKAEEIKIDKGQTERKLLESLATGGGAVEEEKSGVIEEETHDVVGERLQLIKEKIGKLEGIEVQKVSLEEILKALNEIEEICKEALEAKLDMKELREINKDETEVIKGVEDKIKEGENIQKKIEESCETVVKVPEVFEIIREYKKMKEVQLKAQYYLKNAVKNEEQVKRGRNNARKGKKEEEPEEQRQQGGLLELSEDGGEIANIEEIVELSKECEEIEELKEKGNIKEMIEGIEKIKKEIGDALSKDVLDIQEAEKIYKETKRYKVSFQEKAQLKRKLREYFKRIEEIRNKEYSWEELPNVKAEFEKKVAKETRFKEGFKNRVDKAKKIQKDAEKFLNKKQFNKDDIEKNSLGFINEMNEIKVTMPAAIKEDLEGLQKSVQWLEKLYKFRNKCLEKNKDMEEEHQEGVDVLVKECGDVREGEWSELYKKNYEEFKQIMKEGEDIKHKDQRIEKVLKEHASLYCDIEAGIVAEKSGHTSVEDVNKVCEIGQHFHVEKTEGVFDRVTEVQRKYTEWIQAVEEVVGSELIKDVLEEGCNGKEGEVDQLTEKADNLVKGSGHLGVDAEEDNKVLKCVWRRLEWSKKGRSLLRMIREGEHVSLEAVEDFIALGQETKVPYNSWLFREIDKELDHLTTMKEQFEEMKKVRKNMKKRIRGVGKEWDQKRKKKELDRMVKKKLKVSKVKALYENLKKSSLFLEKAELEEMEAEIKRCEDWSEKVKNYIGKYGGKEIEEATEENWKDIRANVSSENAKEIIKELSDLKNEARDLVLRDEAIEGELARFEWIFRATIFTEKTIEKKSGARSWMKLQKVAENEKRESKKLAETNLFVEIQKELEKYQEFVKKMDDLKAKENALMRKVWNMSDADLWTVERETIKKEDLEQLLKELASDYRIDVKQEAAYIEALLAAGKENINFCSQLDSGAYGEKVPADIVKGVLGRFKASFVEFKEEEEALLKKIKKADEMRAVLNQFIGGQESAENVIEKYKECPIYFAEAEKIGEEYKKACDTIEKVENLCKKEEKDIKLEEVQGISKRVSRITLNLGDKLDDARKKIWRLKIQAVRRISQQEENNSETTQLQIEELKKYLVEGLKLVKHPEDQGELRDEIQWTEDTVKDVENKLQELKEVNEEEKLQEVNKVINGFVNISRELDEQKRVLKKRRLEKEREEEAQKQEELLRKRALDELIEKATAAVEQEESGEKPAPEEEEGEEEITKKLKNETGGYTQQFRQKAQKKKQDDEMTRSDLRAELAEALKISKAFKGVKDRYPRIAKRVELLIYLGEGARINCHCASIDKICAAIEDLEEGSETAQRIIDGDYDFEYLKKLTLVPSVPVISQTKDKQGQGHVVDEESPIEEIQPQTRGAEKPQERVVENIEEEEEDEIEEIEEEEEEEDEEEDYDEDEEEIEDEEDEEEIIESVGEGATRIEQEQVAEASLPIYEKGSVLKIFEGKIVNTSSLNRSTSLSLGSSSGLKLCSMYTCEDCKTVRTFPKISQELNVAGRGALRDTLEYIEMLGRSYLNNAGSQQNKPFLVGWIECKRDVQPDMNKLGEELLEKQRVLIIKYMEYADMYILHPAMVKKELASLLDWYPRVPLGQRKPKGVLLFYIHLRIGRTFRGHFEKIEPINMGMPDPDQSKKEVEEKKALEVVDLDEGSEPVSPLTSLADGEIDERENMQRMQMNMMNMMGMNMNVPGGMMNMQQLMAGGMFGAPAGPGGNIGFNPELMNMWNQNMMQQQQTQMITSSFGAHGGVQGQGGANMVIDDDEEEEEEEEEEEDFEEDEEEIEDDVEEEEDENDGEIIEEVEAKKEKKPSDKNKSKAQQNIEEIEDEEDEEDEEDVELEDFEEEEEGDDEEDEEEEKEEKGGQKGPAATTTIEEDDDDMEIIEVNPGQSKRPPANRQQQQQQQAFGMMGQGQDMMALFNSGMDIQSQYNAMFAQLPEQMKMFYMQGMQQGAGGFMNNSVQVRKTSKNVIEEINLEDDDEPVVEQKGNNDNKNEGQE